MGSIYQNNGYWYYQTYVVQSDGDIVRKQFSLHTTDKAAAQRQKQVWDKKIAQGVFQSPRLPITDVVTDYLKERDELARHGELSVNTLRSDRGSFKELLRFLATRPRTVYLDQFDGESGEAILHEYIAARRKQGVSANTIRRDLRHIATLFSQLYRARASTTTQARIDHNPFLNLSLPKSTKRREFPNQDDWLTLRHYLRAVLRKAKPSLFNIMMHMQIETGARISEVLTVKWDKAAEDKAGGGRSFSFLTKDCKRWVIYSKRRERTVPLDEMGVASVFRHVPRNDVPYVFHNPETKRPYLVSSVSRMFRRLLTTAGIKRHFSTHGVRHGFVSYLLNRGISTYQVGQLVGHSESQITEMYGHVDLETIGSALKKLR